MSAFTDFVNVELPFRVGLPGQPTAGNFPRFLGWPVAGRSVEERTPTQVLSDIGAAASGHNHDGVYSLVSHNHDGVYSLIDHNHDGVYSLVSHNHSGVYSLVSHNHSGVYIPVGGAVTSFNTLVGAVTISAGANITLTPVGQNIEIAAAGGGGTPGGDTTQIQYNNGGAFGGISAFIWDGTNLTIGTTTKLYFRNTSSYIQSAGDTYLDFWAIGGFRFSNPTADTDLSFTFSGTTNIGYFSWMEDEDYFKFLDDILLNGTERLYLGDTGTYIYHDGTNINIVDDVKLQLTAPTVDIDASTGLNLTGANLISSWLVSLENKIAFGDGNSFIQFNNTTGGILIEDDTILTLGKLGHIILGDGTLREMYPYTDLKIDLGNSSHFFNSLYIGQITIAEGYNIVLGTTTGTKIGIATTQKLAFYNSTPIVKPSAYTQTYATADKTLANTTAVAITDTADSTYSANEVTMLGNLKTAINALIADVNDVKQFANSIVDDLQALGLVA